MHTEAARDKFVELRAQGWTLGHIATEIHVSKRTLVDWNAELAAEVQSLRAYELDLLKEKFLASREEDLNRLTRLQKDVEDELAGRPLKHLPFETLFKLAADLRKQIHELSEEPEPEAGAENPRPRSGRGQHINGNGHFAGRSDRLTAHESAASNRLLTPALSSVEDELERKPRGTSASAAEEPARRETPTTEKDGTSGQEPDGLSPSPLNGERAGVRGEAVRLIAPVDGKATSAPVASETVGQTAPVTTPPEVLASPGADSRCVLARSSAHSDGETPSQPAGEDACVTPAPTPVEAQQPAKKPQPQEHCLGCGAELPALLPNGLQPSHYCACGQSLSNPGLNLREHCRQCGAPAPVHGYNAQRLSDTCTACGAKLPPLDPKAFAPWIPPRRSS